MKKITLLQVVTKNTSTIDYTLPLFWSLKQTHPHIQISILFAVANKKQILRNSKFLPDFFEKNNIQTLDYSDFLKVKSKSFASLWRALFQRSFSDIPVIKSVSEHKGLFNKAKYLLKCVVYRFVQQVEKRIFGPLLVDLDQIFPKLNPSLVFYDHKSLTIGFYGKKSFYNYCSNHSMPIVQLPHAPHFIHIQDEFFPFYKKHTQITQNTDFWTPFQYGEPWRNFKEEKSRYPFVGYPGLDKAWLDHLLQTQTKMRKDKKVCLVVMRKFLPENFERPENFDPFTMNYDSMVSYLTIIREGLKKVGMDYHIVIKPHPSNNFEATNYLLEKIGFESWEVSQDPFYEMMGRIDFCVSLFSTAVVIPLLAGIPLVLFENEVQEHVNRSWDILDQMYKGLDYYVSDLNSLVEALHKIMSLLEDGQLAHKDQMYLRNYFPDNSLERAKNRLAYLLKNPELESLTQSETNHNTNHDSNTESHSPGSHEGALRTGSS